MLNGMSDPTPPRRRRLARREQGAANASPPTAGDESDRRSPASATLGPPPVVVPPAGSTASTTPNPRAPAADPVSPDALRALRLRRRPRRPPSPPGPNVPADEAEVSAEPPTPGPGRGGRDRRVDSAERALRGLVTTRGTQISWSAATRARVVSAPTQQDLEAADAEVTLVRRNYTPPEPLRPGRGPAARQRGVAWTPPTAPPRPAPGTGPAPARPDRHRLSRNAIRRRRSSEADRTPIATETPSPGTCARRPQPVRPSPK